MIEDLLAELALDGWTVSWAFQFAPDHWRVSIIQIDWLNYNGCDQPNYKVSHCADASTFQAALEDAILRRNDARFIEGSKCTYILEPSRPLNLVKALGLHLRQPKLDRRI